MVMKYSNWFSLSTSQAACAGWSSFISHPEVTEREKQKGHRLESVSSIAEMEGLDKKNNSVRQLIIRVSDQLRAGEINLIETTPEETEAAKARLDTQRKKRRERHARQKKLPH